MRADGAIADAPTAFCAFKGRSIPLDVCGECDRCDDRGQSLVHETPSN